MIGARGPATRMTVAKVDGSTTRLLTFGIDREKGRLSYSTVNFWNSRPHRVIVGGSGGERRLVKEYHVHLLSGLELRS